MKSRNRGLWSVAAVGGLAMGLVALTSAPAGAQTAYYPDGPPKPARLSSLPDWNGIWERDGDNVWDNRIPPGVPQVPPYNEEYKKLHADLLARLAARPGGPRAPGAPMQTMPGMLGTLFPMDVQISRTQVTIMSENSPVRRIYTDGRAHSENTLASSTGHSVGKWVNGELHVDTCCVRSDTRLPGNGPHSDEMRIKERFYLKDYKTLVNEVTVEDPKAFAQPWTTVKIWYRRPDWESVEYDREENDRHLNGNEGVVQNEPQ